MNGAALVAAAVEYAEGIYRRTTWLPTIPAISPEALGLVRRLESEALHLAQLPVATEHLLHGGMYARTVRLKPYTCITGAQIKRATMLIVNGRVEMLVNTGWTRLDGFNVLPASAYRKQVFVTLGDVQMTMIFPTKAQTVEDAEAEFTGETHLLLSRRQGDGDTTTITGE